MKKVIRSLFLFAVTMFVMVSCSGNKLDTERIFDYAQIRQSDFTKSDYDFFIDQMEIIVGMTKGMDEQQANEFYNNMPSEQRQAVVVVNLVLMSADDKLTDEQRERLLSL